MSRHVKIGLVAMVFFVALVSLTYARGTSEPAATKPVELSFASWMVAEASGGEVWLPERIKVWEKSHPNVTVKVVPLAWEDTPDKITLQVQAGNAPDVFTIESLWLGKFGNMPGAVEDLGKYMTQDFVAQLVPAYNGGVLEGKTVGLVWSPNPWVLVYNKALVQQAGVSGAPTSFDDFLKQVDAVSRLGNGVYGAGLQLAVDEYSADTLHILMWHFGGGILDSSGKSAASSPGTVQTVQLVTDLVQQKKIPFGDDTRKLRELFAQDKIGFMFEGPWIAGVLDGEGMSRDKWDVSTWPGKVQPASHILMMSQASKQKDLAWDLMKYIVTDEPTTKGYFEKTGLLPMVKSQYDDPVYGTHYVKTYLAQMSELRNPNVWGSQKKFEIETAFMQGVQKAALGQASAADAMSEADSAITKLLSQ